MDSAAGHLMLVSGESYESVPNVVLEVRNLLFPSFLCVSSPLEKSLSS